MLNPASQKPVLYRKANAVDRDQGQMGIFINDQAKKHTILESQQRALKHMATLTKGDISLIQGGPGTGKSYLCIKAIKMILKTKQQRICLLLPDTSTLTNFMDQF